MPELDLAFSESVADLTGLLAGRHDGLTIVRAVAAAYARVLSADGAGVLVRDPRGGLEVLATSDERARFVELLQVQAEQGPCVACIEDNAMVVVRDLSDGTEERWPEFTAAATDAGYRAVYAFPLRLTDHAIGGVNVLYSTPTTLSKHAERQGQALADLAVLGLTQERDQRRVRRLVERTLGTLNDRAHVSQAVGIMAGALALSPDDARASLSAYSVRTGLPLREVAQMVTDGAVAPQAVLVTDS